jgi:ketosteroid isomerase-like protein
MPGGRTDRGEADIRARLDTLTAAIRAHDIETAMSLYAPNVVSFDLEPPLQHLGLEAKRSNWAAVFAAYRRPLGYEVHDLTVVTGDDVGFTCSLNRISGTMTVGTTTDMWVRATAGLRRIGGEWFIEHDHVSVPVDVETGGALRDLTP